VESKEGTDFNTAKGQADDVEGTVDTWRTELQVCVCVCVCVCVRACGGHVKRVLYYLWT